MTSSGGGACYSLGELQKLCSCKAGCLQKKFRGREKITAAGLLAHVQRLVDGHQASAYLIRQIARSLGSALLVSAMYVLSARGQKRRQIRFA